MDGYCPVCKGKQVNNGRTMYGDDCIIWKMGCYDCGSTWNEYYKHYFDGYEITEDNREFIEHPLKESEVE